MDFHEGTHREKKARKVNVCDECEQPILKGETYIRYSIRTNGQYTSHAGHKTCMAATKQFRANLMADSVRLTIIAACKRGRSFWPSKYTLLLRHFPDVYERLNKSARNI